MSANDLEMVSMEEGRTEKIDTEEQAGETIKGRDQIIEQGNGLSDNAKENLRSLDDLLIVMDEMTDHVEATTKPRIPKFPDMIRKNKNLKKYIEPSVVSIGPYHHGKKNLELTQVRKLNLAAIFIKEHEVNKEDLYLHILREIEDLRKCYEWDGKKRYDDDYLTWMFLIDGCVVLLYIYSKKFPRKEFYASKGLELIKGVSQGSKFTMDLLLLENQLPYRVLELLVNASKNSEKLKKSIKNFIAIVSHIELESELQLPGGEEPSHLLELMRKSLIQSPSLHKKSSFIVERIEQYKIKSIEMLSAILGYLIFVILYILPFSHTLDTDPVCRNIVELKEAGIKLKSSGTRCLTDISFSGGTLKLPSILMNKLTAFKFINLVAHELSLYSTTNNFEVSSYVNFLATLIFRIEDVKELRNNKILVNYSVSDGEVVKIFEEIRAIHDMLGSLGPAHNYIRTEIQDYCSKSYNTWIAQLKNKYFESPWTVIGLVGAIIALSVTILQTIYTILAYYEGSAIASSRLPPST